MRGVRKSKPNLSTLLAREGKLQHSEGVLHDVYLQANWMLQRWLKPAKPWALFKRHLGSLQRRTGSLGLNGFLCLASKESHKYFFSLKKKIKPQINKNHKATKFCGRISRNTETKYWNCHKQPCWNLCVYVKQKLDRTITRSLETHKVG